MTTLVQTTRPVARPRRNLGCEGRPPVVSTVRLLTLNIGAAAVPRARDILRWLRSRADDVVVLTETSNGAGSELLAEGLRASGFTVRHPCDPRERGVLLGSRIPVADDLSAQVAVTLPCRASAVVLATKPRKIAL